MDSDIDVKLDALQKYVPYCDFVIGIDREKYVKFVDIKKWIVNRKRLPVGDLTKIEKSMITSYKNMTFLDKKIPQDIAKIFYIDVEHQFVNLCSDDEEEEHKVKQEGQCKSLTNPRPSSSGAKSIPQIKDDSDDDIELVSISLPNNSNKPKTEFTATQSAPDNADKSMDATSQMLAQIDNLSWKPRIYTYKPSNSNKPKTESTATQPAPDNAGKSMDGTPQMLAQIDELSCKGYGNTMNESVKPRRNSYKPSNSTKPKAESTATQPAPDNADESMDGDPQKFNQIDDLSWKCYGNINNEPKKYCELLENKVDIKDELLFQRRTRKTESTDPEATNKKFNDMPEGHVSICDTVFLDSSDDDNEICDKNTKFGAGYNKAIVSECNNNEAEEIQFKNLTTDEMLKIISARIPNLDYEQLQGLNQQVQTNTPKENHLLSSSSSETSEQNEVLSRISPVPAAPRRGDQSKSPEPLIKALYEIIDKMIQPGSHARNRSPPSVSPFSTTPEQYQQQLHYPQQPQQHNYYNNIPIQQTSMCHQAVGITQPMYPHAFTHMNQNAVPSYNLAPSQTLSSLKARDPRAKSYSYLKSLQDIHAEMQERLSLMQANNFPQSNPQPIMPNNSFNSIHQPMTTPATVVAAQQQQQQQLYRMSTGIKQPNRSAHQQQYAHENRASTSAQANTKKPSISYGEYKRRKTEEEQKQRDEEKRRKEAAMRKNEEQYKLGSHQTDETTCKKDPYQEKIEKSWKAKEHVETNNTSGEVPSDKSRDQEKEIPNKTTTENQKNRITSRMNRVYKEMECTFKGFDKLPTTSGGKRRSSIHARSVISEQLNSTHEESQTMDNDEFSASINKSNRRYSLHASQCNVTNDNNLPPVTKKRRYSIHHLLNEDVSKKLHSISPPARSELRRSSTVKNNTETRVVVSDDRYSVQSSDSETTDFERFRISKTNKLKEMILKKQPKVVLKRLTEDKIKRHTKRHNSVLDVHLIESGIRTDIEHSLTNATASAAKKPSLKKCNNDCIMTERNTKFCVLCSSKPSDLTSHYKRKHKCESYVSRLTWEELDELYINTPFAKPILSSKNSKVERYEVMCPFCDEKLQMPFMNLYNHYSSHTGEYAFQCAGCQLDKPFRADIQSHQLHAKNCRNSQIQTMYRYQSNTMSIYLHYCTICNFVQLNEANVLKHLREHHDPRKAGSDNVQKCILAAISDGPEPSSPGQHETNNNAIQQQELTGNSIHDKEMKETLPEIPAPAVTKLEIKPNLDDDIPVCNEACAEDPFGLEERLKQMHEGQINKELPMTVIHLGSQSVSSPGRMVNTKMVTQYESRVFKAEAFEVDEKIFPTSPIISNMPKKSYTMNFASHSIYREYPANVNYLGFYKCMAGDCFYSSDAAEEFAIHMEGHQQDNLYINYLLCPYCILPANSCQSVHQLVEHLKLHHAHMVYQCSMCCYRSCEALYVLIHQREMHLSYLAKCAIYKCSGEEARLDFNYIKENMMESVSKVQCPYCSNSYYNTYILMLHMSTNHNLEEQKTIRRYSCVYCSFWGNDQFAVQKHIALQHPGELPYLIDHNLTTVTEDALHNLVPSCFGEPVPISQVTCTYDAKSIDVPLHEDIDEKPSVEELIRRQAEPVKVRLRKLTEKTGVPPDYLYRCSDQACGGFFSVYNLWMRHMREKHHCLETRCPHCTVETTKSLEEFAFHFEAHRLHTYICFHCTLTTANAENAQDHWLKEHSELGQMQVEQIRFNLNYSYYIMLQPNKFQNQMEFLSSLSELLDRRIQELKDKEASKLHTMWLVSNSPSPPWLEDIPQHIFSTKLVKKCFNANCNFRSKCDETLFNHVKSNHDIGGSIFKCSKCDFTLENSTSWDVALNHIKQHSETSFFICGACNKYHLCRTKLSEHIRLEHSARDVPIVNLMRTTQSTYAKVAIAFANDRLTFSTMRNCFGCEERSISGKALMLHLKRYHNFIFSYFCEWCNLPIDSLLSVEKHFTENHITNKMKIRCELATKDNISILSISDFKIQISNGLDRVNHNSPVFVKQEEPDYDDSIIILEDDDVIAENFDKSQNLIVESACKPKLKCISMQSLLDPNCSDRLRVQSQIKIVHQSSLDCNNKTIPSDSKMQPRNITGAVISSQRVVVSNAQLNRSINVTTSNTIAINPYESMPRIGSTVNQNQRACNSGSINGPITTAFLNSPFMLPPAPSNTAVGMTNAHLYQNVFHAGSVNTKANTSIVSNVSKFPVNNTNVIGPALLPHSVVTTLTNNPSNSRLFYTRQIRAPNYAVSTSAAAPLLSHAMHPNLSLQSSVSSISNFKH